MQGMCLGTSVCILEASWNRAWHISCQCSVADAASMYRPVSGLTICVCVSPDKRKVDLHARTHAPAQGTCQSADTTSSTGAMACTQVLQWATHSCYVVTQGAGICQQQEEGGSPQCKTQGNAAVEKYRSHLNTCLTFLTSLSRRDLLSWLAASLDRQYRTTPEVALSRRCTGYSHCPPSWCFSRYCRSVHKG
jgi:hypothetical protein